MRIICALFCLFPALLYAQLETSTTLSAGVLVQDVLLGPGVKVSNITFTGSAQAIGGFTAYGTNLGIDEGIVITTGTVFKNENGPQGPNNNSSSGFDNNRPGAAILNDISSSSTFNAALLEFDFTAVGDSVSFNYVFGSEEYIEYVDIGNPQAFNDVFGLFISGPGIDGGTENIAKLSNGDVVSINNVNHLSNTGFYVDNGDGSQEPYFSDPQYIQYDGFTRVLTASSAVQCGETYHLTIAIADVGDGILDSGIFLEAQSLKSKPLYEASHTISDIHFVSDTEVAEGCTSASIKIEREEDIGDITVPIVVSGTATEAVDFEDIPASITFSAGQMTSEFSFDVFADGINEPDETIRLILMLLNECGDVVPDTIDLVIKNVDPIQVTVPNDTLHCGPGLSTTLRPIVTGGLQPITYLWDDGSVADSLVVSPSITENFSVTVTDFCLNSTDTDAAEVYVQPIPPLQIDPIPDITESCPNTPVTVKAVVSGGSGGYTYSWQYKNQEIGSLDSVALSPSTSSVFQLVVRDECGLIDTIDINYFVTIPLLIPEITPTAILCPGDSVQLNAAATLGLPPYSFSWPHSGETTSGVWVRPSENTTYAVEVSDACQSYTVPISTGVLLHVPEANFDFSSADLNAGTPIQLTNQTVAGVSYTWDFGNGSYSTETDPEVIYNDINTYTITLISLDSNGCYDTISKIINIGHVLYIPNTFTPDGNKFNNEFFPVTLNIEILKFEIFNRWGEVVFSETEDSRFKWDGTYKGKPCPDGIYTYKILYLNPSKEEFSFAGHVNVLR